MGTGAWISAIGHGALIALALLGPPWFGPRGHYAIRVTNVRFISEAEFAAAQPAAPAELSAPRPAAQPEPVAEAPEGPAPEVVVQAPPADIEAPDAPEEPAPEVAVLEPPAGIGAADVPDRIVPRMVIVAPRAAAAPPRQQPAPLVESEQTPSAEVARPAELPKPATALEPGVARVVGGPAALPYAAVMHDVAEEIPPATLALQTSAPPRPRPQARLRDSGAESLLAALKRAVAEEVAQRKVEPQVPPATGLTSATTTVTEPTPGEESSPAGNSENGG